MTIPPADARLAPPPDAPKRARPHSGPERELAGARHPARVLVVEDDFLIAMQTETALREAGFQVIGPATTAEEAVALAADAHPCLAVMDIRLASKRDGID